MTTETDVTEVLNQYLRAASADTRTPVTRLTPERLWADAEALARADLIPAHPDRTAHLFNRLRQEQLRWLEDYLNTELLTRAADGDETAPSDLADRLLRREGFAVEDRGEDRDPEAVEYVRRWTLGGHTGTHRFAVVAPYGRAQIVPSWS